MTYSVVNNSGSTYNWSVPADAQIISGQGTNQITVTWGSQSGNVSVTETNSGSCVFPTEKLYVDVITGNKIIDLKNKISIYPNPASTYILIEPYENYKIKITDINSRVVFEGKPISGKINIEGLENGVYFVELVNDNENIRVKFLKN